MSAEAAIYAMQGIMNAGNSIVGGYVQKSERDYNAKILEGQASATAAQGEIEQGQYQRAKGQYLSKSVAATTKQGIGLQGSALAAILDTQTQIEIDQAISRFNNQRQVNYTLDQAASEKRAGKAAVMSGYVGAFSSLLSGGSKAMMYNQAPKTTFDQSPGGVNNIYQYTKPAMKTLRV